MFGRAQCGVVLGRLGPFSQRDAGPIAELAEVRCRYRRSTGIIVNPDPSLSTAATLAQPRDITELLNYRLARLIAASGAAVIRLCEGKYGVSRREWHMLGLLAAHGAQSPSELADKCHLDRARVSRAITLMTGKGLIRRHGVATDLRRASVELTALGTTLYRALFADIAAINTRLVAGLSPDQLAMLDTLLDDLTHQAQLVNQEFATQISASRWRGSAARPQWPGAADE
jgi:DNA-binding MarR family transcriptional regulator